MDFWYNNEEQRHEEIIRFEKKMNKVLCTFSRSHYQLLLDKDNLRYLGEYFRRLSENFQIICLGNWIKKFILPLIKKIFL